MSTKKKLIITGVILVVAVVGFYVINNMMPKGTTPVVDVVVGDAEVDSLGGGAGVPDGSNVK